ncbi:MAG: hypothetical protein WBB85_16230 [Albidovulum sp.]|uniref:hypothetical protein n=1 Tax=Albidovulum sp. TaxID=1872424 RepID=UPI003C8C651F
MTTDTPGLIAAALAELKAATSAQARAISRLETALEQAVQQGLQSLPATDAPPCEHRRAHRPGVARRIDSDPELQTFIRARIERMTFAQVAEDVAAHFPPERRVRRSAIHAWWKRENRALGRFGS